MWRCVRDILCERFNAAGCSGANRASASDSYPSLQPRKARLRPCARAVAKRPTPWLARSGLLIVACRARRGFSGCSRRGRDVEQVALASVGLSSGRAACRTCRSFAHRLDVCRTAPVEEDVVCWFSRDRSSNASRPFLGRLAFGAVMRKMPGAVAGSVAALGISRVGR